MKIITGKALYIFSLLINLYLVVLFFGNVKHGFPEMYYKSDCLYLPSLYRDLIVEHNSLNGWTLNPSPNFLPEWPVYFLFNFLSGDLRIASFLYALFNFFGISLLIAMVYKAAFQRISWLYLAFVNFAMSAYLFLYLVDGEYILSGLIFLSAFHNGVFINSLFCIWLFLVYLTREKNYWFPGILFILSLLSTLSDKLFVVFFTLPLVSALFLWKERSIRPKMILSICCTIAGTVAGLLAYGILEGNTRISFTQASVRMFDFEKIPGSFSFFIFQMWNYITSGGFRAAIILVSAAALLVAIIITARIIISNKSILPLQAKTGMILLTSFIILVILSPIVNGSYFAMVLIRYNIHAFYLALTLPAVFFHFFSERWKPAQIIFLILAILIASSQLVFALRYQNPKKGFEKLSGMLEYYPENIARLDSLANMYGLRNGISEYWYAKPATLLSEKGLKVRHVYNDLLIYNHVSNRNWYIGEPDSNGVPSPLFNFIIVGNSIDSSVIRKHFGQAIDTIYSNGPVILKVPDFYYSSSTKNPVVRTNDSIH